MASSQPPYNQTHHDPNEQASYPGPPPHRQDATHIHPVPIIQHPTMQNMAQSGHILQFSQYDGQLDPRHPHMLNQQGPMMMTPYAEPEQRTHYGYFSTQTAVSARGAGWGYSSLSPESGMDWAVASGSSNTPQSSPRTTLSPAQHVRPPSLAPERTSVPQSPLVCLTDKNAMPPILTVFSSRPKKTKRVTLVIDVPLFLLGEGIVNDTFALYTPVKHPTCV